MRYNALRLELAEFIAGVGGERKPALRRSRREDRMYATDLAGMPEGPERDALADRLWEAGWDVEDAGGWLELRKRAAEPPEGWYDGAFGPEAACCRRMLERHPEQGKEDIEAVCRLVKAGEEGPEAYELACREIHGRFAERLRRKEKLPKISMDYFGGTENRRGKEDADSPYRTRGVPD